MPGFEAPVNLVYSQGNRSAAVRIPLTGPSPKAKRLEFRSGDALANPYVAFSAMTRTKAWLHISGIGEEASLIIDEINQICSDLNSCSIKFQVPNINRLRALDTEEHRKIRKANIEARVKKGSIIELLKPCCLDLQIEVLHLKQQKNYL